MAVNMDNNNYHVAHPDEDYSKEHPSGSGLGDQWEQKSQEDLEKVLNDPKASDADKKKAAEEMLFRQQQAKASNEANGGEDANGDNTIGGGLDDKENSELNDLLGKVKKGEKLT